MKINLRPYEIKVHKINFRNKFKYSRTKFFRVIIDNDVLTKIERARNPDILNSRVISWEDSVHKEL